MTAPHDLDRQLHAFLQDGPTELPDPSFDAVRDRIESTRQRVVIGPWRLPDMNKLVPIGLGAAAVVVALVIGTQVLGPPAPARVGGAPTASPSATPSPTLATTASSTIGEISGGDKGLILVAKDFWFRPSTMTTAADTPCTIDFRNGEPPGMSGYDVDIRRKDGTVIADQPIIASGESAIDSYDALEAGEYIYFCCPPPGCRDSSQ